MNLSAVTYHEKTQLITKLSLLKANKQHAKMHETLLASSEDPKWLALVYLLLRADAVVSLKESDVSMLEQSAASLKGY